MAQTRHNRNGVHMDSPVIKYSGRDRKSHASLLVLIYILIVMFSCITWWTNLNSVFPVLELLPFKPTFKIRASFLPVILMLPIAALWLFILLRKKGKWISFALFILPTALAAIDHQVPSFSSCWLLLFTACCYFAAFDCKTGRAALLRSTSSAVLFAILILLASQISLPLEARKKIDGSRYQSVQLAITEELIQPLEQHWNDFIDAREASQNKNTTNPHPDKSETDIPDAEKETPPESNSAPLPDTGITESNATDLADTPFDDTPPENNSGTTTAADTFSDMNSIARFRPSTDVRLDVTVAEKPTATVYYPRTYGGTYQSGKWSEVTADLPLSLEHTQYPDTIPQLIDLCVKKAPQTLQETSNFIQQEFENNLVYDYNPGTVPAGKELVEYFLFENKKGFCIHFATTAALMYRICGYPSRYVEGYAIPASAFSRQSDGTYLAHVTGEMGHAWCEVYDTNTNNWITKEHTLSYHGPQIERGLPASDSDGNTFASRAASRKRLIALGLTLLGCVIIGLGVFLSIRLYRVYRHRQFRRLSGGIGMQKMYQSLYNHRNAVSHDLKTASAQNADAKTNPYLFSREAFEQICSTFPQVSVDELNWFYQTVLQTMFFKKEPTRKENNHAYHIYRSCMPSSGHKK